MKAEHPEIRQRRQNTTPNLSAIEGSGNNTDNARSDDGSMSLANSMEFRKTDFKKVQEALLELTKEPTETPPTLSLSEKPAELQTAIENARRSRAASKEQHSPKKSHRDKHAHKAACMIL